MILLMIGPSMMRIVVVMVRVVARITAMKIFLTTLLRQALRLPRSGKGVMVRVWLNTASPTFPARGDAGLLRSGRSSGDGDGGARRRAQRGARGGRGLAMM